MTIASRGVPQRDRSVEHLGEFDVLLHMPVALVQGQGSAVGCSGWHRDAPDPLLTSPHLRGFNELSAYAYRSLRDHKLTDVGVHLVRKCLRVDTKAKPTTPVGSAATKLVAASPELVGNRSQSRTARRTLVASRPGATPITRRGENRDGIDVARPIQSDREHPPRRPRLHRRSRRVMPTGG